jgi:DNA-binding NarL/FixJ family response regulator
METVSPDRALKKSQVFLVEDHPIVRQGLAMLIDGEPDLAICGTAESVQDAVAQLRRLKPDVAIVDISLGDGSGLDLIAKLHEDRPNLPMLALSMHDENLFAERAVRAGAKGYVMKKEATKTVMTAIRRVLTGTMYFSDRMTSRMLQKLMHPQGAEGSPMESLSNREFEVFRLISNGLGPSDIAQRLKLSVKTVAAHRENIKEKLHLENGTELTRFALQWAMQHGSPTAP